MTSAELLSAERGHRPPRGGMMDLVATLALGDTEHCGASRPGEPGCDAGLAPLHLMAKRNDVAAVRWLLANGADPNERWAHWDADVTPLHLAASQGHAEVVRAAPRGAVRIRPSATANMTATR